MVVGVALTAFGALVLLRFPDRPGGKMVFRGVEVSSAGAGLPLIVLGVATVALGFTVDGGDDDSPSAVVSSDGTTTSSTGEASPAPTSPPTGTPPSGCFAEHFASLPPDRVSRLEDGADDIDVIVASQPKEQPFGVVLTKLDQPIGAVTARFFRASGIFRVLSVVDAECRAVEDFSTSDSPDKHVVQNWNGLRMRLGAASYLLTLGGRDESIRLDFHGVAAD